MLINYSKTQNQIHKRLPEALKDETPHMFFKDNRDRLIFPEEKYSVNKDKRLANASRA